MRFTFCCLLLVSFTASTFCQSISYDESIGAQGAKQVIGQMGIYEDSSKTTFINSLGQNLVSKLGPQPFSYKFQIVDQPEPNAFALPAGHIYVSRGLLVLANNEDQLAGVIGHEIIHSHRRHTIKQMRKSILPGLLQVPGAIVRSFSPDLAMIFSPLAAGSKAIIASHSRGHEKEADEYGISIAAKAGYNPNELAIILDNLSAEVMLLSGEEEKQNWLSDHPYTPKRLSYIKKKSEKVQVSSESPITNSRKDFLQGLDGLVFGDNPQQGVFHGSKFLHPEMNFAIDFPENWTLINTPMAAGAIDTTRSSVIYLTQESKYASAKEASDSLAIAYEKSKGFPLDENKNVAINGLNGQLTAFVDKSGSQPINIFILWIEINNQLLRVVFAGIDDYKSILQKSAESFRTITIEEKAKIKYKVVQIVEAYQNESLEKLSQRTGNQWDSSLTAIINGIDKNALLENGQLIKIAVERNYKVN